MHTDWSYLSGSQKLDPSITMTLILCVRIVVPKEAGQLAVDSRLFGLWFFPTSLMAAFSQQFSKHVGGCHGQNRLSEARGVSKPRPLEAKTTTEIS